MPVRAAEGVKTQATVKKDIEPLSDAVRVMVIVDDNEVHLEVARIVLEKKGFTTELVSKPLEAFDRLRQRTPDFIILDVMMPEVSGVAILKRLKETPETAAIPVFVASAYDAFRAQVEALGAIWLPKPWNGQTVEKLYSGSGRGHTTNGADTVQSTQRPCAGCRWQEAYSLRRGRRRHLGGGRVRPQERVRHDAGARLA